MQNIDPIGIIFSPHKSIENMPIQPKGASGFEGQVKVKTKNTLTDCKILMVSAIFIFCIASIRQHELRCL